MLNGRGAGAAGGRRTSGTAGLTSTGEGRSGARPTVAWGIDFFAHWPHVKNLVPHHSLYSFGRMQNVWLDR